MSLALRGQRLPCQVLRGRRECLGLQVPLLLFLALPVRLVMLLLFLVQLGQQVSKV